MPVPVKDGAHSDAVRTVPVELRGQQDSIFRIDGAVGEWRDEQLVPAWQIGCNHRWLSHQLSMRSKVRLYHQVCELCSAVTMSHFLAKMKHSLLSQHRPQRVCRLTETTEAAWEAPQRSAEDYHKTGGWNGCQSCFYSIQCFSLALLNKWAKKCISLSVIWDYWCKNLFLAYGCKTRWETSI